MVNLKKACKLFLIMFKIGLFTFGGGYAMIPLFHHEYVEKRGWVTEDEFMELLAIGESTPGPLAINSSTYIGYKLAGIFGSIFATLGMCLPSIIIIFVISLFFDKFLANEYVAAAFKGIQACVVFLILNAGIKLLKNLKKNALNYILFGLTCVVMFSLSFLGIKFSSIYYILIGGIIGIISYLIMKISSKKEEIK